MKSMKGKFSFLCILFDKIADFIVHRLLWTVTLCHAVITQQRAASALTRLFH